MGKIQLYSPGEIRGRQSGRLTAHEFFGILEQASQNVKLVQSEVRSLGQGLAAAHQENQDAHSRTIAAVDKLGDRLTDLERRQANVTVTVNGSGWPLGYLETSICLGALFCLFVLVPLFLVGVTRNLSSEATPVVRISQ